jgi:hypothetical protein
MLTPGIFFMIIMFIGSLLFLKSRELNARDKETGNALKQ